MGGCSFFRRAFTAAVGGDDAMARARGVPHLADVDVRRLCGIVYEVVPGVFSWPDVSSTNSLRGGEGVSLVRVKVPT